LILGRLLNSDDTQTDPVQVSSEAGATDHRVVVFDTTQLGERTFLSIPGSKPKLKNFI
jgi:hypothetical protein